MTEIPDIIAFILIQAWFGLIHGTLWRTGLPWRRRLLGTVLAPFLLGLRLAVLLFPEDR